MCFVPASPCCSGGLDTCACPLATLVSTSCPRGHPRSGGRCPVDRTHDALDCTAPRPSFAARAGRGWQLCGSGPTPPGHLARSSEGLLSRHKRRARRPPRSPRDVELASRCRALNAELAPLITKLAAMPVRRQLSRPRAPPSSAPITSRPLSPRDRAPARPSALPSALALAAARPLGRPSGRLPAPPHP